MRHFLEHWFFIKEHSLSVGGRKFPLMSEKDLARGLHCSHEEYEIFFIFFSLKISNNRKLQSQKKIDSNFCNNIAYITGRYGPPSTLFHYHAIPSHVLFNLYLQWRITYFFSFHSKVEYVCSNL